MTTVIGIIACGAALLAAALLVPRMRRLEEAVARQSELILHLTLYAYTADAYTAEERLVEQLNDMQTMQDTLAGDYPELITPPEPDYPTAYDKWGEFDA